MESQISLIFDPTIKLSGLDIMIRRYLDIRTIQDDLDITSISPYLDIRNIPEDLDITTISQDFEIKERKKQSINKLTYHIKIYYYIMHFHNNNKLTKTHIE